MSLPKRKLAQVARVFANKNALNKLFSNKKRTSRLNSSFYKINIRGKDYFVKFNRAEGSQQANINNMHRIHSALIKYGKIKNKHYVLAPSPYIYAMDEVCSKIGAGVMRDLGESTLGACINYLEANAQERAQLEQRHPTLKRFIVTNQLILNELKLAYEEAKHNLSVVECASTWLYTQRAISNAARVVTDLHSDNLFVLGKTKTGKVLIAAIDQIEPEFTFPGSATHMTPNAEKQLKKAPTSQIVLIAY